jgi:hypothetical protein
VWLTLTGDDGDAVITVRDTGPGVPVDRQEAIFEPFTQGEPTARQGGLGIGLSLVRRIVELHSGSVDVGSTDDGAAFTVRLPITDEIPPVPAPARVTVLRQRIVVIEDNDDGREALVTALGLMGHEVRAAATGQAGIELVLRGQPQHVPGYGRIRSGAPTSAPIGPTDQHCCADRVRPGGGSTALGGGRLRRPHREASDPGRTPPDHHPVSLVHVPSEAPPNPKLASTLSARHGIELVPRARY